MGQWTREELQAAHDNYVATAHEAGRTGNWRPWAELFTEDAQYIEHHYGTFDGREAIRFRDPGDGKVYEAYNVTVLKYAGEMQFSSEEDVYNPAAFAPVVKDWIAASRAHGDSGAASG